MRLIIDAGCNLLDGYRKLTVIENINDFDKKIFVEANPECWDYLDTQLYKVPNSKLYKNALSTEFKTVELITRSEHYANTAATILGKDFLDQSLMRWNMTAEGYKTYNVATTTIDKIISENNAEQYESIILKLDVEGMEYAILPQILNSDIFIEKIYCEFHVHCEADERNRQILIDLASRKQVAILHWD